jgi:hypothetical protein
MAAADHDPSRRALLGAAVGLPFVSRHPDPESSSGVSGSNPPPSGRATSWIPDQVRDDGEWQAALAAFEAAAAKVRAIEAATAGCGFEEEEEALLPAHEAACEAIEAALRWMLFVPAPHLPALGIKFEAAFAHELAASAAGDDLRFRAIRQDIVRLWSRQGRAAVSRR